MDNYILNVVMVLVTMWIVRKFWNLFYEKRKISFWSIGAWVIFFYFRCFFMRDREMLICG
jgi:hypothetical protein